MLLCKVVTIDNIAEFAGGVGGRRIESTLLEKSGRLDKAGRSRGKGQVLT